MAVTDVLVVIVSRHGHSSRTPVAAYLPAVIGIGSGRR
jgi:hypothetical protein